MALCDHEYNLTYVDVGTPGRFSDGGTFDSCSFKAAMEAKTLGIPPPSVIEGYYLLNYFSTFS